MNILKDLKKRLFDFREAFEEGVIPGADLKAAELDYSKRLDVHRWSDHPEVNKFVDEIYDENFKSRKKEIRKKHLKVVLLDLYVNWSDDPDLKTTFARDRNAYKAKSIYNELRISNLTIDIVDILLEAGFVDEAKGFYDKDYKFGRQSRIWPTVKLIDLFKEAAFSQYDIGYSANRVSVVLRDNDPNERVKTDLEYEADENTNAMQRMLDKYNRLLETAFIDIPSMEDARVPAILDSRKTATTISQKNKFVRRIFNRGSFDCGGRFYGGWWQNCPKAIRSQIFINGHSTTEIDFSGLHIVMLYAMEGINYWDEVGVDPYAIELKGFDQEQSRSIAKALMLVLINAKTSKKAYAAFRRRAEKGSQESHLDDKFLSIVHEMLIKKHEAISNYFGADSGIKLMRKDSDISAIILEYFTDKSIPILSLHDSYIVPCGCEDMLNKLMHDAFFEIMGVSLGSTNKAVQEQSDRLEDLEMILNSWMPYENLDYQLEDEAAYLNRAKPKKTKRYMKQFKLFSKWQNEMNRAL